MKQTKNKDTQPEIDHGDVLPFRVGRLLHITIALEVIFYYNITKEALSQLCDLEIQTSSLDDFQGLSIKKKKKRKKEKKRKEREKEKKINRGRYI